MAVDLQRLRASSEEDLARDARGGCVASFEELARRVQAGLVAFVQRRFPSRRDAEDVAQEALVRAYVAMGSYREGRRFRPWVFAIAYRVAVNWGRKEKGNVSLMGDVADGREGPGEAAGRLEQKEWVWAKARAVLSEEQVMSLWLYYVEEMGAAEVARVMGRSWVSVRTMLHRARRKLGPHLVAGVETKSAAGRAGVIL